MIQEATVLFAVNIFFIMALISYAVYWRWQRKTKSQDHFYRYLEQLKEGQHKLSGNIEALTSNQNSIQALMANQLETRLDEVKKQIFDSLSGSASKTAQSLGALQEKLVAIDKAQGNLEKLSGEVLGLQDILANKQTRGAFGEIQLKDIVSKALPPDSYAFQVMLSNGKRADCLVYLPNPPGPIVIDSKFPLEAFELIRSAKDETVKRKAYQEFRRSMRSHIASISEKYIIDDFTADGAVMFLPSESVYAELHSNFLDVVREGFSKKVWIVSPTTCMATLNTIRAILQDAKVREHSKKIRENLSLLFRDVSRLGERVENLDKHLSLANRDLEEVKVSAKKVTGRADRLDKLDFNAGEDVKKANEEKIKEFKLV